MSLRQMAAIEVREHGGPDALREVRRPVPGVSEGEVLVRNRWIGVNWVDLQHTAGHPYPVTLPLIPGTEASGEVVKTGADVTDLTAGTPVVHFGHLAGVYAEYTVVPIDFVVPLGGAQQLRDAAALAINATTAQALVDQAANLRPGDLVVVHAAAGGTGGALVQLAAYADAEVVAITSSAAKASAAMALGAHHAISMENTSDLLNAVLTATGGRRADVVFDGSGRETFETSLDLLAARGLLLLYGQSGGSVSPFDPADLSGLQGNPRRKGSLAVRWASVGRDFLGDPSSRRAAMLQVLRAVEAGRLSARIAAEFPLSRAADAHRLLASRQISGKILLSIPRTTDSFNETP